MKSFLKKLDQKCDEHALLLVLLLIVVVLRIPSFFEPYWYGDEAIYLTLGTGLKQGLRLYTDIIDHKTPLIYYFAMVPNQFWFRVLMMGWMMAATGFFFSFARRLFQKGHAAFASSLLFVLLTTLPWLEGNIPNGELFVIGFVMAGLWLLGKTRLFEKFLDGQFADSLKMGKREPWLLLGSGALFGLGVLTKVPGILDFGGAVLIGWFALASSGFKKLWPWIQKTALLGVGLVIPLVLSVIYYVSLGSGRDYLDYGLLYNFRYSANWQLGITNPLLAFFFTLPGKVVALAGVVTLMSFVKKFSPRFRFVTGWLAAALLASLLSNRPYPHYFLQIVPPFALLVGCLWQAVKHWQKYKTELLVGAGLLVVPFAVALILNLRPYEARSYYRSFYQLVTGQINQEEYNSAFNPLVANNYAAADAIAGLNGERIFIWGTNPMLYAQTHTTPTSRFTVAFHIKDFHDHERTFEQIQEEKPKIIVVMKDENDPFPQLAAYLDTYYMANTQYPTMTIYLRRNQ